MCSIMRLKHYKKTTLFALAPALTMGGIGWQRRASRCPAGWSGDFTRVVSFSPDGEKVLVKVLLGSRFEIREVERVSGKLLRSSTSETAQLSLTWSPLGNEIVFQQDAQGDRAYRLA